MVSQNQRFSTQNLYLQNLNLQQDRSVLLSYHALISCDSKRVSILIPIDHLSVVFVLNEKINKIIGTNMHACIEGV